MTETQLLPVGGELSATAYKPPASFDYDDFERAVGVFDAIEDGHQCWIGDALRAAREHLGEDFDQLVPEEKADTWKQYIYVTDRVDLDIRKRCSQYSKMRVIASLSRDEQIEVTDNMEDPADMTFKEFKAAISGYKKRDKPDPAPAVPTLTFGRFKELAAEHNVADDDPVSINLGPGADNLMVTTYPDNDGVYIEGWEGHKGSAVCKAGR